MTRSLLVESLGPPRARTERHPLHKHRQWKIGVLDSFSSRRSSVILVYPCRRHRRQWPLQDKKVAMSAIDLEQMESGGAMMAQRLLGWDLSLTLLGTARDLDTSSFMSAATPVPSLHKHDFALPRVLALPPPQSLYTFFNHRVCNYLFFSLSLYFHIYYNIPPLPFPPFSFVPLPLPTICIHVSILTHPIHPSKNTKKIKPPCFFSLLQYFIS